MSDDSASKDGKGILHPEGMRAVRHLSAGVVHEVNNILGVIIGNVHLAKKNASNEASVAKYMAEVRNAAEDGRELMRSLALLAGDVRSRPRLVSLDDLVESCVSAVSKPVELDLSGEAPSVELDLWLARETLTRVATLMAETRTVSGLRVASRVVGEAVALTLEDDGVSPSQKELQSLFAPFTKLDRRPKSGMAFAMLADLASRCGGYVAALAREPNGLRIVVTLPLAARSASGDGPGVPLSKKSV